MIKIEIIIEPDPKDINKLCIIVIPLTPIIEGVALPTEMRFAKVAMEGIREFINDVDSKIAFRDKIKLSKGNDA